MGLLLLAQTALTLATPFIIKSGEKIAENVGEEVWSFITKTFDSANDKLLIKQVEIDNDPKVLEIKLLEKIKEDSEFADKLKEIVENAQKNIKENAQQINNNAAIEKQINIQNNSGSIQM